MASADVSKSKVAVTGASGLLGSALVEFLNGRGWEALPVRRGARGGEGGLCWDPGQGRIEASQFEGLRAVVHLSGRNLAVPWTPGVRKALHSSRVESTRLLAAALAALPAPPRVVITSSAVGYYGFEGGQPMDEGSPKGEGFLAGLCGDWEAAALPVRDAGIRLLQARTAPVVARGGPLSKMFLPFKLGLGAVLGSGKHVMSWIALRDWLRAMEFLLNSELEGPVNLSSPNPVTHADFCTTLASVLHRPLFLRVPGFILTLALGQMARETMLGSTNALPKKLLRAGFDFEEPYLEAALRRALANGTAPGD